jgi:hypothetical protein
VRRGALLAAVLLVAGCGVRPGGVVLGGPASTVASAAWLYLVSDGEVVPVLRPGRAYTDALTLLAAGPTAAERDRGLTTEVPAGIVFDGRADADGTPVVTASVDVTTLSPNAFAQIVCTASPDAEPVTIVGGGQSRGPQTCPVG